MRPPQAHRRRKDADGGEEPAPPSPQGNGEVNEWEAADDSRQNRSAAISHPMPSVCV